MPPKRDMVWRKRTAAALEAQLQELVRALAAKLRTRATTRVQMQSQSAITRDGPREGDRRPRGMTSAALLVLSSALTVDAIKW